MEMDRSEIQISYKLAKDKVNQIQILAELNYCSVCQIAEIVKDVEIEDDNLDYSFGHKVFRGQRYYVNYFMNKFLTEKKYKKVEVDGTIKQEKKLGNDFCTRLYNAIQDSEYSKTRLVAEIGTTNQQMNRWLNGETYPTVPSLIKLSELLNVSCDYLLKGVE